jgi:hypothetical protein
MRLATTLLLGFGLLASGAWTQQQPSGSGIDPRLDARLDPRTRAAVVALLDSARRAGIPTDPLVLRALEGASKKADGRVIVVAVRNYMNDLSAARSALGPSSSEADVLAGASALRAGVSVRELEKVRAARAGVRIATAVGVMGDLVSHGVSSDTATALVSDLVRLGVADEQLVALQREIVLSVAGGTPAGTAAVLHGQGLEQQLAASLPPGSGGASGTALPSGRGSVRGSEPSAVGTAVGNRLPSDVPAGSPTAPRGRPKRRP